MLYDIKIYIDLVIRCKLGDTFRDQVRLNFFLNEDVIFNLKSSILKKIFSNWLKKSYRHK